MFKSRKGITLISLVVTIIIILILASISINMLYGNNSILQRAIQAREDAIIAQEKEQIALAWNSLIADKTTGKITEIDEDNFEIELNNIGNNTQVDYVDNDVNKDFLVIFIDTTHEYIVDKNGNIILKDNKVIVDEVSIEEYIVEQGELNSKYSINGWGSDARK